MEFLKRFDEKNKDEAEAVHNSLAIVENIIEIKPYLSLDLTKQSNTSNYTNFLQLFDINKY